MTDLPSEKEPLSEGGASYRQILKNSSIVGGASIFLVLLGMLRNKALAALLGPAGVGLAGLLASLMATISTVGSFGLGQVGTRQIAEAKARGDESTLATVRWVVSAGTWTLGIGFGALMALCGQRIAERAFERPDLGPAVSWLGLGVAFSVCATGQAAILNGMRRIPELSLLSVLSGATSAVVGVAAIWIWEGRGLLAFLLAAPIASYVIGIYFVAQVPTEARVEASVRRTLPVLATMARLGVSFMIAGLVGTGAQLVVRMLVQNELGLEGLGLYQAAWTISMTYIGFVLSALGTDFYPRLTAATGDDVLVNRLVNQQSEIALLLAAPVFLAMLALAPWVMSVLYSAEFSPAASLLRLQILGDVLKIASWPIGFIILAAGDGRSFLISEASGMSVFVLVAFIAMPWLGLNATGVGFVSMYLFLLPLVYWRARKQTSFRWSPRVRQKLLSVLIAVSMVGLVSAWHPVAGLTLGLVLSAISAIQTVGRLSEMTEMEGVVGRLGVFCRRLSGTRRH